MIFFRQLESADHDIIRKFNNADTLPKKYAIGGLHVDAVTARHAAAAEDNHNPQPEEVGGLTDHDATATRPKYQSGQRVPVVNYPDQPKRDLGRKNEVCFCI